MRRFNNRIMGRNKKCICLFLSNKKVNYTTLPSQWSLPQRISMFLEPLTLISNQERRTTLLLSLTMIHKVFFQISKWFSNNIQFLLYKYQKYLSKVFKELFILQTPHENVQKNILASFSYHRFVLGFFYLNAALRYRCYYSTLSPPLHQWKEKKSKQLQHKL